MFSQKATTTLHKFNLKEVCKIVGNENGIEVNLITQEVMGHLYIFLKIKLQVMIHLFVRVL